MGGFDLDGAVVLVTGASRGIGRATAAAFAEHGAKVMLVSRTEEDLVASAATMVGEVAWHATNVADADGAAAAIAAVIERFGRLDVLVNNVSTNPYFGPLMKLDADRARRTVEVNQWAMVMWTQLAWKCWMRDNGGRVVNISSIGAYRPEPSIGWYNGTKSAVVQLTRQLAQELAPGVTVNCVAPGIIKTDMSRALWEPREAEMAELTLAGRLGDPADIAGAVLFLASHHAQYITGQTLTVDGGITLGRGFA